MSTFDESKVRRGQPGNAGQFAQTRHSEIDTVLLPISNAADLASALSDEQVLTAARDWETEPDTLAQINSRGDNPWLVDLALVQNPHAPANVLDDLASSDVSQVRQLAANHATTPAATLSRLATDRLRDVRASVAANPRTETADLVCLAKDDDLQVVLQVVSRVDLPRIVETDLRRSRMLMVHEHLDARERVAA